MIILYYKHECLRHIIDLLSYILNNFNIIHNIQNIINQNDNNLYIGIWNDVNALPKNFITLNTEPLNRDYWKTDLIYKIKKSIYVIDYSYTHTKIYENLDINNFYIMPFIYSDFHEIIYNKYKKNEEKTIDILFYGSLTSRRLIIFDKLSKYAKSNNLNFVLRDNVYSYKEKIELISKSKIVLSISSYEPDILQTNDMFRLSFLLSNKIFFISEKIGDAYIENELLKDSVYFKNYNDLEEKILYYLKNEDERNLISKKIYDYCKKDLNMNDLFPISKFLEISKNYI